MRTRNMVSASNLRPFHAKVKSSRQKFRSLQRGPLYVLQEISFGNISGVTQMHCELVWLETIVPSCPTKADKQLLCLMPRISSTYGAELEPKDAGKKEDLAQGAGGARCLGVIAK